MQSSGTAAPVISEKYVAKANDGVGGVGYEAMIVTGELVRDLGSAKFIPIIRQRTDRPEVPTSVSTRRYINLSEGADCETEIELLLRDLHSIRPDKPPLGSSPFAMATVASSAILTEPSAGAAARGDETAQGPFELYQSALRIAGSGDVLKWRRIVGEARRAVKCELQDWFAKYAQSHPGTIGPLIEQSVEGVQAFAPLTAIALGGVASGRPKFSNQIGLLEDILNPDEWQRGGLVIRVELPETGAFAYQALLGAMCLYVGNSRAAIDLARCGTESRKIGKTMPLWQRHDIVAWPESLGKNATKAWEVALGLAARWPWLGKIFTDQEDYQAALYAYYVTMSFVEFVERVRAKFEIPEDPVKAHWWPDVPVFFEATPDDIKRRGYQLVAAEKDAIRSWLSEFKVDEKKLIELWPHWIGVQTRIFAQERPFFHSQLSFARLIDDLFGL